MRLARDSILAGWEFIGRVVDKHPGGGWLVDLGADYDQDYVVVPAMLHLILHDLNVPGVIESYMRQRTLEGYRISRRRGPNGKPVDY